MTDRDAFTRRRILLGLGAGTTVALAGCASAPESTETETGESMGTETATEDGMGTGTGTETEMGTETGTEDGTETGTDTGAAMVRVAHLSPNAPNVDVYVDGNAALEDVPFGAVSDYLELPAGAHTVEITAAGDAETSVFEGEVTVEAETSYTVAAIGELGDEGDQPFEPLVLEDQNEPPGDDMARVRAVHASPDAPAVDITVASSGDALFDGVPYGESGYVEVPAGDYTLQIRGDTEGNDGDVAAEFDVSVEGGQVYTAFAAGYLSPDDEPADTPFDLIVAQDTA
jgi:hypothetical protein